MRFILAFVTLLSVVLLLFNEVRGFIGVGRILVKRNSHMMSTIETNKIHEVNEFNNIKINEIMDNGNVNIEELNDDNFVIKMNENNNGALSVVLFTSDWCGPCNTMDGIYKSEILSYVRNNKKGGNVKMFSCNTDANQASCQVFMVRSIPTIIMFRDGEIVSEIIGSVDSSIVTEQINKYSTNFV